MTPWLFRMGWFGVARGGYSAIDGYRRLFWRVWIQLHVSRGVAYTQGRGCAICLHVGATAYAFGYREDGRGPRVEILTPSHRFRYSPGYIR